MSNDNKTLADVQPGGRVRLGDGAGSTRVSILQAACGPEKEFDRAAAEAEMASIPLIPLWELPELHSRQVAHQCLTTMERARQSTKPTSANRVRLTDAIALLRRFITQLEINERSGK
ncbi:TPA: hypothetical protein ACGCHN_001277 [Stenotrophomonas maltophilia]